MNTGDVPNLGNIPWDYNYRLKFCPSLHRGRLGRWASMTSIYSLGPTVSRNQWAFQDGYSAYRIAFLQRFDEISQAFLLFIA
jgi:hypothetical protein